MSSRVCVKGLPEAWDEARLREAFARSGEVTDARVVRRKDGRSRQFGFVGYKSHEQAQEAVRYFHRSFLGAARVAVELAEKLGSGALARPWSKYSEGSSAHLKKAQQEQPPVGVRQLKKERKRARQAEEGEEDPQLAEFLQLMQPRHKKQLWANDAPLPGFAAQPQAGQPGQAGGPEEAPGTPPPQAAAGKHKGKGRRAAPAVSERGAAGAGAAGEPAVPDAVVLDPGTSDMDYLRSRKRAGLRGASPLPKRGTPAGASDEPEDSPDASEEEEEEMEQEAGGEEEEEEEGEGEGEEGEEAAAALAERRQSHARASTSPQAGEGESGEGGPGAGAPGQAQVEETRRLFVRNLPFASTEEELRTAFGAYGELQEVHLVLNRVTKASRGLAFVQFVEAEGALAAMAALDGSIFQGRLLHVLPGEAAPHARAAPGVALPEEGEGAEGPEGQQGGGGFKREREAQRKAGAAGAADRAAWNALYMRPDSVAEAVAAHYGLSVSELMDGESSDLAVRLALGEAQVLALTKRELAAQGVAVASLEAAAAAAGKRGPAGGKGGGRGQGAGPQLPRSPTVLLVKNLPYAATLAELQELFGAVGPLERAVLPSTRGLGLVAFREAAHARRAFRALAYKRFKGVPLYLEWAPAGVFSGAPSAPQVTPQAAKAEGAAKLKAGGNSQGGAQAEQQPQRDGQGEAEAESSTLFVKDLAWETTSGRLKKHFQAAAEEAGGQLRSCRVAQRKGPKGALLSAGYGFVECSSVAVAQALLRQLQGSALDGHKLALQLSQRSGDRAAPQGAKEAPKGPPPSTKLVVRNVAFEATRKDLSGLLGPLGQLKSVRLPRKFDGSHRGFAFVEFLTKQEAASAKEAAEGTHLYGRRLVLEWAQPDAGPGEGEAALP